MNILELMAAPFAECLVLVAIHTYLGIHVLKRRVIFVDLALAQIAALGTTVGFLFGIMPETAGALIFSMAFTFLGAAVFSITRLRHERVPQEAVIGLTFAIAFAIAVLVVDKTKGAEHLKDIMVGNLLWVSWSDVATAAIAYTVIGAIHVVFRKHFLVISENPDAAYRAGMSVRAWDFFFYLTFGAVIAFSTRVAGVLLVFVFLVAPAILAFMLTARLWPQLLIGWGTGTVVTVVGLYLSWTLDLPSGPAVIVFYGVALVVGAIAVFFWRAPNRARAGWLLLRGGAVTTVILLLLWSGGRWLGSQSISVSAESRQLAADLKRDQDVAAERDRAQRDSRHDRLTEQTRACVGPGKVLRYLALAGPEQQLAHVQARLSEELRVGLEFLLIALADEELPLLYRTEAVEHLVQATQHDFGYDPEQNIAANATALDTLCDHIRSLKPGR